MTKNKKIAVIVCAIIVIATAIIVPVTVHKIHKSAVEPLTSGVIENTSEDSEVVSLTRRETTTAVPETTEAPSATEAPVTTAPETTKKQNQSVTTTKPNTTKSYTTQPAPTQSPAPATTAPQNTYGLPAAIANSNTVYSNAEKKACWDEDIQNATGVCGYCESCGKPRGNGTHGTCMRFIMHGGNCPLCGKYVEVKTCHSCVY